MATIFILANTVRPSVDRRLDDTAFRAGTFSWQDPVHSWKAGPGEVMTVEILFIHTKEACPHHIIVILAPLLPFGVRHNTN